MGAQHTAMEEDAWMTDHAKNIVRQCYVKDTGGNYRASDRVYMDWCEGWANKWIELCDGFGYKSWTNEIRTLTGSITYHEWLKKEVGL